jgi:hypothetical protein
MTEEAPAEDALPKMPLEPHDRCAARPLWHQEPPIFGSYLMASDS